MREYVVVERALDEACLHRIALAYDRLFESAAPMDVKHGSTSARIGDVLQRDECFAAVPVLPALLDLVRDIVGPANAGPQKLHKDVQGFAPPWPLAGFILMVDGFTEENDATRFVPGSAGRSSIADDSVAEYACGPAGSLVVFNGCVWHGHGANRTPHPRRSLQGGFVAAV